MTHKLNSELARPELSVVIGSNNALGSIRECLSALAAQRDAEIIIVDNSTDGTAEVIKREFPHLKLISAPGAALMPELWEAGIRQSNGEIVAITTSHFVPRLDWVEQILRAHDSPYTGIGGAIENDPQADLTCWAIYFCRYSQFMLPFAEREVQHFAGDNASYKRRALELCEQTRRDGFWETLVHIEFAKMGLPMLLTPAIIVQHQKSFDVRGFIKQRFEHGKQFGASRVCRISLPRRCAYILLSPLIPVVFLLRIAREVFGKRGHVGKFLLALPVLTLFLLSWTAGELRGYLESTSPAPQRA